ncbi:MAG: glucan biosynthesis protein G [Desulfobacterales bacterium]|jgi:glucans biosynthesis protein
MNVFSATKPEAAPTFTFEDVVAKAKELAAQPFQDPKDSVPDFLLKATYDQWRDIRFEPDKSLWRSENLPFEVQFFHLGFLYDRPVKINEIDAEGLAEIPFAADLFNYGANDFKTKLPENLGFAGFRLHYPINRKDYRDEVAVFLGASYFRAVGKNMGYGLSARGLAIDTALDSGEEFPYFREYWLVRPALNEKEVVVYALLDSVSLAGAYKFVVRPGEATLIKVEATIFRRREVGKLGIAPLTSMFLYGENTNQRSTDDFRPEIHDSDGLLIADGTGEIIWRPLVNPQRLLINAFQLNNPKGFGLLQRDLDFDHYQDLEARYDKRPSVWIAPVGEWGKGSVELIQIPSSNEIDDNIVSFWVPASLPDLKEPISFAYTMSWHFPADDPNAGGYVSATRTGMVRDKNLRLFIIDFKGGKLDKLPDALPVDTPLEGIVDLGEGSTIVEKHLVKNEPNGGWRLVFQLKSDNEGPLDKVLPKPKNQPSLEMRAYLKEGQDILTETWSYGFLP